MEYESNSHSKKEDKKERQKLESVVTGEVKVRKKNAVTNTLANVFAEDISKAKNEVVSDVIVPAIRTFLSDVVQSGLDIFLGGTGRKSSNHKASRISYNDYSKSGTRRDYSASRTIHSRDDISYSSRGEAQVVLDRMEEALNRYGIVSVADLNDLSGISGNHTDTRYGWTDLQSAHVVRTNHGYILKLPKAMPLD